MGILLIWCFRVRHAGLTVGSNKRVGVGRHSREVSGINDYRTQCALVYKNWLDS